MSNYVRAGRACQNTGVVPAVKCVTVSRGVWMEHHVAGPQWRGGGSSRMSQAVPSLLGAPKAATACTPSTSLLCYTDYTPYVRGFGSWSSCMMCGHFLCDSTLAASLLDEMKLPVWHCRCLRRAPMTLQPATPTRDTAAGRRMRRLLPAGSFLRRDCVRDPTDPDVTPQLPV